MAKFKSCSCAFSNEHQSSEEHLCVSLVHTTLESLLNQRRGAAVSYTWGAFDRKRIVLGHMNRRADLLVTIQLGLEWDVLEFSRRLRDVSSEYEMCWIDQVCLSQARECVRASLADMPVIFSNLPVIALLPGSLCNCLQIAYNLYRLQKQLSSMGQFHVLLEGHNSKTSLEAYYFNNLRDTCLGLQCLNSNGCCSWPDRVWPYQEIMYSTSLRIMWSRPGTVECCTVSDTSAFPEKLQCYFRSHYQHAKMSGKFDDHEIWLQIRAKNSAFASTLGDALLTSGRSMGHVAHSADSYTRMVLLLARFLLGDTITREETTLLDWKSICGDLADSKKGATDAKDYVLSIWTMFKGYRIPDCYESLSAYELLEDAMSQPLFVPNGLSHTPQFYVPSTCPAGLFGAKFPTYSCVSTEFYSHRPIRDSRDVYGRYFWTDTIVGLGDVAYLKDIDLLQGSLAEERFTDLADCIRGVQVGEVVKLLDPLVQNSIDVLQDQLNRVTNDARAADEILACLVCLRARDRVRILQYLQQLQPQMPQNGTVRDLLMQIICEILYLDVTTCQTNGTVLMFARGRVKSQLLHSNNEPKETNCVYIGLCNTDCFGEYRRLRAPAVSQQMSFSVAVPKRPNQPLYQVVRRPDIGELVFSISGVWIPLEYHFQHKTNFATITGEAQQARLH